MPARARRVRNDGSQTAGHIIIKKPRRGPGLGVFPALMIYPDSLTTENLMKEIQLRWMVSRGAMRKRGFGIWHPDTPDNRKTLEAVRDAGNETFGDGTHWIVEREA